MHRCKTQFTQFERNDSGISSYSSWTAIFSSWIELEQLVLTFDFKYHHKPKSAAVKSGEYGGELKRKPLPISCYSPKCYLRKSFVPPTSMWPSAILLKYCERELPFSFQFLALLASMAWYIAVLYPLLFGDQMWSVWLLICTFASKSDLSVSSSVSTKSELSSNLACNIW